MRVMRVVFAVLAMTATAEQARAAFLLLTPAYEAQLEDWGWRGENLDFNTIFTHTNGDGRTSYDFHNAADGMGATIVLLEVTANEGASAGSQFIIGGYNPVSWRSDYTYTSSVSPAPRTAFLFNLSTAVAASQRGYAEPDPNAGSLQTYNSAVAGPSFGVFDLRAGTDLNSGVSQPGLVGVSPPVYDYSNFGPSPTDLLYGTGGYTIFTINRMEVLTFAQAAQPPISTPEPTSLALAGFAGLGMTVGAWRRRRQQLKQHQSA